ncbi:MAG TPA: MFS transporter [Gammaproteobacteria bacterium]|nr:MFS transporter [Gammaproteobacteria bacterium]
MPSTAARPRTALTRIPHGVWALGLVSLFMDISSEMIHALLPVFLVTALGVSVTAVGLLEGIAEAVASITKVFSGALSDRLGKRKFLTVIGYGLAALTKPLFAIAPNVGWVFAARFADRIGKGIRGAPRDALIAELAPAEVRGASFGLRQALDTVGAFAGPLLAIAFMAITHDRFRTVFWIAVIPALISVALLIFFVKEPARARARSARPTARLMLGGFDRRYWWLVIVAALFTLARFSEAFLILKASEAGLAIAFVPLVLVVMNIAYATSAYPAGWLSDRVNRWAVLGAGSVLLIAADLVLAWNDSIAAVMLGIALWGLHMGFTQGLFAALIADASKAELRGTAFGIFNFITGLALLAASVLAGVVWDQYGPQATFLAGAALTAIAGVVAVLLHAAGQLQSRAAR